MGVGPALVILLLALMQGVYSQTWGVKLPRSIRGISGSCVTIPCGFEIPKNEEANIVNCSKGAIWRENVIIGRIVFSDLNPEANIFKGELLGDLTKKNCTTTLRGFPNDYTDSFFFRLQCSNHVRFTFDKPVDISIKPALPPPDLTSAGPVLEGSTVSLRCSVPVPCPALPPSISWLPRDDSRMQHTLLQQDEDGLSTLTSTLTFTASADHHNQSVACSASYPLTTGGSSSPSAAAQTLSVLYAPRVPVVMLSPSGPVSAGRIVVLSCFGDANPPVSRYSWYRLYAGQMTKKGEGELLHLQVGHNSSGVYLCEAHSQRGSSRSRSMSLEVSGPPDQCVIPFIICGLFVLLFLVVLAVDVYKHQSILRRLQKIELKGEQTYADLKSCSVSDYDRIQSGQPKTMHPSADPTYQNPIDLQAS